MSSVTVDELIMRIEIELDKFRSEAAQAESIDKSLRESLQKTGETSKKTGEKSKKLGGDVASTNKEFLKQIRSLVTLTNRLVRFFAVITGSNAMAKLGSGIAQANDHLGFLQKRLGMTARDIRGVDTAVAALGGSGAGAMDTLHKLNQGIQQMVLMGDDSLIPFFSALGIGVIDASGKMRAMDDILLDMADSFSRMDPQQAYALANAMGLDEGVTNALVQGRDALQDMMGLHQSIYVSTEEEIRASRELARARAVLAAQWNGLKTIIGNSIIPLLTKMTETVSGWVDYLNRNEQAVRGFFHGVSLAVGVVLLPLLAKGAVAIAAFIAPFAVAAGKVALLAAAFMLLYDDYKAWAEGGESLFDWTKFHNWISNATFSVDNLGSSFAYLLTGYKSFSEAGNAFMEWMRDNEIIDDHGVSLKNLGDVIRRVGMDALESIPAIKTVLELVSAVMEGDWAKVGKLAMQIPMDVANQAAYINFSVLSRVAGTVDTVFGIDPDDEGSFKNVVDDMKESLFGDWKRGRQKEKTAPSTGVMESVAYQVGMSPADFSEAVIIATETGVFNKEENLSGYTREEAAAMSNEDRLINIVMPYMHGLGMTSDRPSTLEDARTVIRGGGAGAAQAQAMSLSRSSPAIQGPSSTGITNNYEVSVGTVTVQTSANTLPAATADGVAAGLSQAGSMLDQLGGGIQ